VRAEAEGNFDFGYLKGLLPIETASVDQIVNDRERVGSCGNGTRVEVMQEDERGGRKVWGWRRWARG
jgi:hypothetical protein